MIENPLISRFPAPLSIFVYGTLKPGEINFDRYCHQARSAQPAWIQGQLYALPLGYPGLVLSDVGPDIDLSSAIVEGVLLSFDDPSSLNQIDELEDYHPDRSPHQNEYQRNWRPVWLGSPQHRSNCTGAWVYSMGADRIQSLGGIALAGLWTGEIQQKTGQQQGWPDHPIWPQSIDRADC